MLRFATMRIAIVGTRGVPAMYGGFETMAAELSSRLAQRGHEVTVYCRAGRTDESHPVPSGVRRRFVPFVPGKYFETITHTAASLVDAVVHPYDAILLTNAANAVFAWLPRLRGTKVALNVDGIERQRAKWGIAGRIWYSVGERFAQVLPHAIVADARVIQDYYRERYGRVAELIAYGATVREREPAPDLSRWGIADIHAGDYFLYVSRLEPENQALLVIEAYKRVPGDHPLLVVGDAPYATAYKERLRAAADQDARIRLTGAIYGDGYGDLQRGALAYVQATAVGGTHPALIEAMAAGNLVLAFRTPENIEVTAGTALLFGDEHELATQLGRIVRDADGEEFQGLRRAARDRAVSEYSWDAVTARYEALFNRLLGSRQLEQSSLRAD
jgi:glycosyltransferase involved in cell wall biosynthesis